MADHDQGQGYGTARVQLLYAREPEIRRVWASDPGDPGTRPRPITTFMAYPLDHAEAERKQRLGPDWKPLDLPISPPIRDAAKLIDRSLVL